MISRAAARGTADGGHGLRDVGALRAFLTGPGIVALFDSPWVPLFVAVIYLFHPLLGAIALGGALAMLALAAANEKLSRGPLDATLLEARRAGRFAELATRNAEVACALGMAGNPVRGWQGLDRRGLEHQLAAARAGSLFTSATRDARQLLQVTMLAAGAWLVIEELATPGVMIAATILLGRALAPVEAAIAGWKALVDARAAYRRLDEAFSGPQPAPVTELPAPAGTLSVEQVLFGFPGQERPVIRRVSFSVAPGEALAIVGPSATGKSTLARLMVGVWRPLSGAVRLDGAEASAWPRERLGPHVGYVPQDVELFGGAVSENIARMGKVDSAAVIEAAQRARAHEVILRLPHGYDTPIGEGGVLLSAGQRQRVALARALYGAPRLVVLDEPSSNLDIEGESALLEAIGALKAAGVALVIINHRTRLLEVADRILVLREGAVERIVTSAELPAARERAPEPAGRAAATQLGSTR